MKQKGSDSDADDKNLKDLPTYMPTCYDPKMSKELSKYVNKEKIEFVLCTDFKAIDIERSKKVLELINALKFDKLTYPLVSRIKSMWIDVFFHSIVKKQNVMAVEVYLKVLKTNLIGELTTIIHRQNSRVTSNKTQSICK